MVRGVWLQCLVCVPVLPLILLDYKTRVVVSARGGPGSVSGRHQAGQPTESQSVL